MYESGQQQVSEGGPQVQFQSNKIWLQCACAVDIDLVPTMIDDGGNLASHLPHIYGVWAAAD